MNKTNRKRTTFLGACLTTFFACSCFSASAQTTDNPIVIGTAVGTMPQLPATVNGQAVTWDAVSPSVSGKAFTQTVVKGKTKGGKSVVATIVAIPENVVYVIDAGAEGKSALFEAAKQVKGDELLNDKPDAKYSASTRWGYIDTGALKITPGQSADWATSFVSDTDRQGKGVKYNFTLSPGMYKVIVAHVPHTKLSYSSALRVDKALKNTQTVNNLKSDDGIHNPTMVTHSLRLLKPTTVSYETKRMGGEQWQNAAVSMIVVEKVGSNLSAPLFSSAGGDSWGPATVTLSHKEASADIRYTLDGTKPGKNSTRYTSPITINKTQRVRAIAYLDGDASQVVTADFVVNTWAVTATLFKLKGEQTVNNVKLNWMTRDDANVYKVYRDGTLIGETAGDTFDDYGLTLGKSYAYYVEGYKNGAKVATAEKQSATPFKAEGQSSIYDNLDGKETGVSSAKPSGFKIGKKYYQYKMERGQQSNNWTLTESSSATGMKGSWSKPRVVANYPGNLKFEGNAFRYNGKTGKVVFSSHYEDQDGYTAAKIFLAQVAPGGQLEIGTQERPLGYDSRDQSLFIDEDNTAYLLSATNTNSDINIYRLDETWTKPVALVNTVFQGKHRETPAIVKRDGIYYFYSSKASGWYPSQAMYASATKLDGVWTPLRETGNSSTYDSQTNNVQSRGTLRQTYALWSYHWGAQRDHKDAYGNFPRVTPISFNDGFASLDYYRWLEFNDKYGIIPVQNGRNLSQGCPVTATVASTGDGKAECIVDGADLTSSPSFQGARMPYSVTIDLQRERELSEVNISTKLINGSEAAYKYTLEGSVDGENFTPLVDGQNNWSVGFLILPIDSKSPCRYLRFTVSNVISVKKNNPVSWADGIYEIVAFGR